MPPTLAHRAVLRGLAGLLLAATSACTGWTSSGGPPARDRVDDLEPPPAGTYRLVGTEEDSRTGTTKEVTETYEVQPAFAAPNGTVRQLTSLDDGSGVAREWETEYRDAGAFRLREVSGVARWTWEPAVRTLAAPLEKGAAWTASSTATVPDAAGFRRVVELAARSTVTGTATVTIDGTRLFVFLIDGTVTSTVTNTYRATQDTTRLVTTTAGRTWFAPSRGLAVRTEVRTEVTGDVEGGGYTVLRRLQADRL